MAEWAQNTSGIEFSGIILTIHLIIYVQHKESIKHSPGCGWPHMGVQMTVKATLAGESHGNTGEGSQG